MRLLVVAAGVLIQVHVMAQVIWFDRAGEKLITEGLPVGNGRIGALVCGQVERERIILNEESVWSGGAFDGDNPEALAALAEARRLLFAGEYRAAQELINAKMVCRGGPADRNPAEFGKYEVLGAVNLEIGGSGDLANYRRELDLSEAVARVRYERGGVKYEREIIASKPDEVIVIRVTASARMSLRVTMDRPERFETSAEGNNELVMRGRLSNGRTEKGLRYVARVKAMGGKASVEGNALRVEGKEIVLLVAAGTDYWAKEPEQVTRGQLDAAAGRSFEALRARHVADYRALFDRVKIDLGGGEADAIPTDQRLAKQAAGASDPGLAALYYQFGRYLLISSSRPGDLPANLQGIWADTIDTPWNGDYHTNINVQMNYWLADPTGLPECTEPLTGLIERMVEPGGRTARIHYGARGWTVHTIHNVWGFTSPGNRANWGMFPMAGPWMSQHLWEHYAFTGDKEYLKRVWPVMKGSAEFVLDWLVEDPKTGKLVSGPSNSPENRFYLPGDAEGKASGFFCMAPAMDQEIAWDLFTNLLEAAEEMGIGEGGGEASAHDVEIPRFARDDSISDHDLVERVRRARERLLWPGVGSDGRLMEWAEEFREGEPEHRHTSHLFGLHPGRQITTDLTPGLASAARKSLEVRGDGGTGWSLAWKVCFWARLWDGDRAHPLLMNLLRPVDLTVTRYDGRGGGTYSNLFCAHPPYQIDGNLGAVAGMTEMLLQSHQRVGKMWEVHLLPALPGAWKSGSASGLRARGGFEVDIAWREGRLERAVVRSMRGRPLRVRYGQKVVERAPRAGDEVVFNSALAAQ